MNLRLHACLWLGLAVTACDKSQDHHSPPGETPDAPRVTKSQRPPREKAPDTRKNLRSALEIEVPAEREKAIANVAWDALEIDPEIAREAMEKLTPDSPEPPGEADVRYVRDRYLENVAYADSLVGRVLGILDRTGRYDDPFIVLLSDHGEAFLEHGRFVHSLDLYREVLHIPLVVKWPQSLASFRSAVDEPVSLLDLAPTLVDALALRGAEDGFQGRSLLPLAFGETVPPRALYAVTRGEGSPNRAATPRLMLESGGRSVHFAPLVDRTELYDVERDPGERNDLAPHQQLEALLLRQSLLVQSAWNRELLRVEEEEPPSGELDDESVEQLEALGYLN